MKPKRKRVRAFTIDVARWLRGEDTSASYLLRPYDDKMCCLGQYAKACGFSDQEIAGLRGIKHTGHDAFGWRDCVTLPGALPKEAPIMDLYQDNDDSTITLLRTRVRKIRAGFKRLGVTVRFKGLAAALREEAGS